MEIWNIGMAICRVVRVGLIEEVRFEQRLGWGDGGHTTDTHTHSREGSVTQGRARQRPTVGASPIL